MIAEKAKSFMITITLLDLKVVRTLRRAIRQTIDFAKHAGGVRTRYRYLLNEVQRMNDDLPNTVMTLPA